jgi:two-component system, LytTR family, response regulator
MKLKAVIVDDELGSIETTKLMLQRYCPEVELLKSFEYPEDALQEIPLLQPDVILLDVEMPSMNGFELLDRLSNDWQAEVIFITAYSHYAVRAYAYAAIHYLMKPLEADDLQLAISRCQERLHAKDMQSRLETFKKNLQLKDPQDQSLVVYFQGEQQVLKLADIIRLQADRSYTEIFVQNKPKPILATKPLKEFDQLLTGMRMPFFRIHESHLVNRRYIKRYALNSQQSTLPIVELEIAGVGAQLLPLARRRKHEFINWLNDYEK